MEKLERKLERARSGQSSGRSSGALATFELTRPVVGASALGIAQAAYEDALLPRRRRLDRPRRGRPRRGARPPAIRRSSASRSSRCLPTWPPRSKQRGCSFSARRGWVAPGFHSRAARLDVEAEGRGRRDVGDPDPDGPRRPARLVEGGAASRSGSETRRSTKAFEERRRSSAGSSPRCRSRSTASDRRRAPRSRRMPSAAPRRLCRRTATGRRGGAPARAARTVAMGNGAGAEEETKTTA